MNNEDFHELDFKNMKLAVGGGMAVQRAVAERWKKTTGVHLLEGYGLTECSPLVTGEPIRFDGLHGCDWFTSTVNRSADCG